MANPEAGGSSPVGRETRTKALRECLAALECAAINFSDNGLSDMGEEIEVFCAEMRAEHGLALQASDIERWRSCIPDDRARDAFMAGVRWHVSRPLADEESAFRAADEHVASLAALAPSAGTGRRVEGEEDGRDPVSAGSGYSRAEPSGLGPTAECPSRDTPDDFVSIYDKANKVYWSFGGVTTDPMAACGYMRARALEMIEGAHVQFELGPFPALGIDAGTATTEGRGPKDESPAGTATPEPPGNPRQLPDHPSRADLKERIAGLVALLREELDWPEDQDPDGATADVLGRVAKRLAAQQEADKARIGALEAGLAWAASEFDELSNQADPFGDAEGTKDHSLLLKIEQWAGAAGDRARSLLHPETTP